MQGHKIGCPRLEHLLNFTLRYGYSLWYDVIFSIFNILWHLTMPMWVMRSMVLHLTPRQTNKRS